MPKPITFRGKIWLYQGQGAWHFVSLPKALSARIKKQTAGLEGGFGSLRVRVTIGKTQWTTSVFPYKKVQAYILPLKAMVRKKEKLEEGKTIAVSIELVDAVIGSV